MLATIWDYTRVTILPRLRCHIFAFQLHEISNMMWCQGSISIFSLYMVIWKYSEGLFKDMWPHVHSAGWRNTFWTSHWLTHYLEKSFRVSWYPFSMGPRKDAKIPQINVGWNNHHSRFHLLGGGGIFPPNNLAFHPKRSTISLHHRQEHYMTETLLFWQIIQLSYRSEQCIKQNWMLYNNSQ